MSLRTTLEKLLSLLTKYPNAEYQAKLKTTVGKLQKAATDFQDQLELSTVENSVEYATLAGLLSDPAKKKMVNLAWANKHLKRLNLEELSGKSLTAAAKSKFLLLVAKSESANDLIKELSQTEEEKLQDEFARVAKLSDAQARAELDEKFDKGPKLESFCRANSIPVSKKGARVDRKATYMHVLNALASFRERQKL